MKFVITETTGNAMWEEPTVTIRKIIPESSRIPVGL